MQAVCREEIEALAALRQSEYAHERRLSKNENASSEMREVKKCKRRLFKAHDMRDRLLASQSITPEACPDSVRTVVVYNTRVPSDRVKTLQDVRSILWMAEKDARDLRERHTPRCVLPPLLAEDLATLQNISMREHAVVSLLVRWILNSRPSADSIRHAAQKMSVAKHAERLMNFARRAR